MSLSILMPLPRRDFDPSETGIPYVILKDAGFNIVFATPNGKMAECDERMLNGDNLSFLKKFLAADANAFADYHALERSASFKKPIAWADIRPEEYAGLILPGGHAQGMREYLESEILKKTVSNFFARRAPVGAICHGVVLAARARREDGKSVLSGYKTTALLRQQEMLAYWLTCLWLGKYYRTYPESVQSEVTRNLNTPDDFIKGPPPLRRDSPENLHPGFAVLDRNYLSARWPGDAHTFGHRFVQLLKGSPT